MEGYGNMTLLRVLHTLKSVALFSITRLHEPAEYTCMCAAVIRHWYDIDHLNPTALVDT